MLPAYFHTNIYKKEKERKHAINHYEIPDALFVISVATQMFRIACQVLH